MKTKLFLSLSVLTAAFTVAQEVPVTPAQTGRIAQFKQIASQFGSEMKKATRGCTPTKDDLAMMFANAKAICSIANVKSVLTLPEVKVGGLFVLGTGLGVAASKYNQHAEAQAEATGLANRSYFAKTSDYVSGLAQSAKANTWDSNYGFKHSGKVATVAGVAAVAGLSYLAYKKNPFGRAVVTTVKPTVPAQSSTRKLSRI